MGSKLGVLKRRRVWEHNGLLGRLSMAQTAMNAVVNAKTTRPEAKDLAIKINIKLAELKDEIKNNRID